jgi:hypothetical protein
MADPISITGLVIAVGGIANTVLTYAVDAHNASDDINVLLTELLALKGVLESIESNPAAKALDPADLTFSETLKSGLQILDKLRTDLEPKSKLSDAIRQLKWPLKKKDVLQHLDRLERLKSYWLLVLTKRNM